MMEPADLEGNLNSDPGVSERLATRRQAFGAAGAGAAALAIAGCSLGGSSDDGSSASGTKTGAATPRRGGTFRLGSADSSSSDSLDTLAGDSSFATVGYLYALYDCLTRRDPQEYKIRNHLAELFEPADDLSYWDVRVREANFHNGKPVTADDVIFTLKRVLDPKRGAVAAVSLKAIDPKRLKKMDKRTVRMYLNYPDSTVRDGFTEPGTSIVPTDYDPKHPIGSGPFKFGSFSPGVRAVMPRNDDYWDSGKPYLDQIEFVGFADPTTPRVNALLGGQIDAVNFMSFSQVPAVDGSSGHKVIVSPSHNFVMFGMRMDKAPFDDVRVRQAIRLLVDREQIVKTAFNGSRFGEIGNDLPAPDDPLFNDSIPQRNRDIEQAKSLLKQAGRQDLTVELSVTGGSPGVVESAQVLVEQARAAGVTIKLNNVTDAGTYFTKYYAQAPFKSDYWPVYPVFGYYNYSLLPDAPYNITNWRDDKWEALVKEARGSLDEARTKELMAEAQKIIWDSGTQTIYAFNHTAEAYSTKFAGVTTDIWGLSLCGMHFDSVYQA